MQDELEDEGPAIITLERTFDRVPRFLEAINRFEDIAAALAERGYTANDHEAGWSRYHDASSRGQVPPILLQPAGDATAATTRIDSSDEEIFRTTQAAWRHAYPDQLSYVMTGLTATTGINAVVGMRTYLTRIQALRDSPEREATRATDQQALEKLTRRGITPERCTALWNDIRTVETLSLPGADAAQRAEAHRQREAQRLEALRALYDWFAEWSEIARIHIKKKRHLIALGLANPASPKPAPA